LPLTSPPRGEALCLRDVSIGYDGRPVVSGVDLAVDPGEVVAVLGPNGSGKSTLVRGVLGLAQVLGGTIEVFGEPADQIRHRWRLGYVPQRHTLAGGVPATVQEVVASGRLPRIRPWRRASPLDRERVREAIALVGLAGRERDPVATLSGGQQRRVLIARALAGDAAMLFLDEPTAGVDAANQQILVGTLSRLVAAGATILLVSHELGPAAGIVTRTVVMREGTIAYDGPPRSTDLVGHGTDHHHLASEPSGADRFGLTG
jgi:zinc transport system ATP-binding protein